MLVDASIIVCTFNRSDSLKATLNALQVQKIPENLQWEVIVVDNNSNDHTHAVVEALQQNWHRLRYEFEPRQGLSHARNHGIQSARGKILLFTDDDVLPEQDWVVKIITGMQHYRADACGGYIAPIWETPPPAWLTERFHGFLAIRSDRTDDYPITDRGQAPFGANMAFRKTVFERVGLFDTHRGRKGSILASGEDGEMFERILESGLKVVFLGGARVHHMVETFRLKKSYFRRWRFQTSRNIAQSQGMTGENRIFNIPLYLFPQLGRAMLRALISKVSAPADIAFHHEIIVWHFLGTMQGLWQSRKP